MEKPRGNFKVEDFSKVKNTSRIELNFFSTFFVNAIGLGIVSLLPINIRFDNIFSFIGLCIMIWLLNWLLRPLLVLFTLPFIIFTMGLGIIVINAAIIYLSAMIVPYIGVGSFLDTLYASIIVSILMWVNVYISSENMVRKALSDADKQSKRKDDSDANNK